MRAEGKGRLWLGGFSALYPLAVYLAVQQLDMAALAAVALKLYPALLNLGLLLAFAYSLHSPPTAIERLARLAEPDLAPAGVRYARWVTWVWCGFFLANGSLSLITLALSDEIWLVYNGCLAYVAMGCLFAGELAFRGQYRKRHNAKQSPVHRQ